ncbi:MAG: MOSC domain-containing protein [Syntrophothermus sp.]
MAEEKRISELYIYPVKSLGGISLSTSEITSKGLKYDRRWMITDEKGLFLTQRTYPEMTFLKTSIKEGLLIISDSRKSDDILELPLEKYTKEILDVTVWDDTVAAYIVSQQADKWLSEKLNMNCRLVYMQDETLRKVDPRYAKNDDTVGFADAFPFLIIGQESLNDLNGRLEKKLPMNRFRPNIVFTGGRPYEEDEWKTFSTQNAGFNVVKPCSRCVLTTTDQETSERAKEPLKTLSEYRNVNGKIMFGQNLTLAYGTAISVGDIIK